MNNGDSVPDRPIKIHFLYHSNYEISSSYCEHTDFVAGNTYYAWQEFGQVQQLIIVSVIAN